MRLFVLNGLMHSGIQKFRLVPVQANTNLEAM